MAGAGVAQGTAIAVAMDMTEGIIARLRTMAIFRPSVLTGHVLGSMLQTMLSLAIVLAVAVLIGFRAGATPVEWAATVGVLAAISLAITWLTVACGLVGKSVEAASNLPQPLVFLPFLGSGFVPTDSMPAARRWFAEHQPFTPFIETRRGLLLGTAIGTARPPPSPGAPPSPWSATSGPAPPSTVIPGPWQPDLRSLRNRASQSDASARRVRPGRISALRCGR